MLIDTDAIMVRNPILDLVAQVNGNEACAPVRLDKGVYVIGHFGSSNFLEGFEDYPVFSTDFNCYGVCDCWPQIIHACPEIAESLDRQFVITLTEVEKEKQPPEGGWRWHKWGPYIGTENPQCEYLHDEEGIERVYVYHVYELIT